MKLSRVVNKQVSFGICITLLSSFTFLGWHQQELLLKSRTSFDHFPIGTTTGTNKPLFDDTVCFPWTVNMDEWWTHRPEYDEGTHTRTHQCFDRVQNTSLIVLYYQIHDVQFHSDCSKGVAVRKMWSWGWHANFNNVADGLLHAVTTNIPLQMTLQGARPMRWNYAAISENITTCPTKDMRCYFLPLGSCPHDESLNETELAFLEPRPTRLWVFNFATRSQQWLRKQVYEFLRDHGPSIQGQCSVIHVRRSDVAIDRRKYYDISEYINRLPANRRQNGSNILLLTDDANAIDEALHDFPDLNWHYLDRPRFRAGEGGRHNHFPSQNPASEVIIIKATLIMVQQCTCFVHAPGGFSNVIYDAMLRKRKNVKRIVFGTKAVIKV